MAKVKRNTVAEPSDDGFWDRPVLLNLVADLLIVLGVAGMAWAAATSIQRLPLFPFREVVVMTPVENVTRNQIEQAAKVALDGNFFTIDLDQVRTTFEKLPWVRQATVRRRWPDSMELNIEEHVAVARWQRADGESRFVNEQGEVFAAASDRELPVFSGPDEEAPQMMARFREFSELLAPTGHKVAALTLSSREAWQIKLDDGLLVELGRDEEKHNLAERLQRFVVWYQPAIATVQVSRATAVDLRYPNGFALRVQQSDLKS